MASDSGEDTQKSKLFDLKVFDQCPPTRGRRLVNSGQLLHVINGHLTHKWANAPTKSLALELSR